MTAATPTLAFPIPAMPAPKVAAPAPRKPRTAQRVNLLRPLTLLAVIAAHLAFLGWIAFSKTVEPVVAPQILEVSLINAPQPQPEAPPQPAPPPPPKPLVQPKPKPVPKPRVLQPVAQPRPQPTPAPVPAAEAPNALTAPAAPQEASNTSPSTSTSTATASSSASNAAPVESMVQPDFKAAYLNNQTTYPPLARRLGETGTVLLRVRVSELGLPEQVDIKQSSGSPRLDDGAVRSVLKWRFLPARRGDTPVAAWVIVPVVFNLEN